MKLHWSPRSPFVRKVMIFAHEVGLTHRLELVRSVVAMSKVNRALMHDNPLSRLPTLVTDEGLVLTESAHICEYLDSLHAGPKLFPIDPKHRWPALHWHGLGEGMLEIEVLWRNEASRKAQTPEILEGFAQKIAAALDLLDAEASQLAAAPFSIGSIAIGVALGYLDFRFQSMGWRNGHPQLARWYEGFVARPSVLANAAADD
jgi:glutathione S-transferase